jgi:hypothetical protein
MDTKQLVRNTLQNSFDKDRFIYFVKNLLNSIDESKAFHARGYVPEIFKDYVKTYERLGTYTDPEEKKIDILIVYLQRESTLERARTAQRNFTARYLKDRGEKDAGLIAFVSPNKDDWRFSFVKMEYKLTETPKGTIKAKEEFTPARRYSFLVGCNESSHTAQRQLVPILSNDKTSPVLADIEDAFHIEKVTQRFFEEYRRLFLEIKESLDELVKKDSKIRQDFKSKSIDTVDFAKKLLGQIVFLYFLQKKGWFGVERDADWGTGPKNFLRQLFEKKIANYDNFFNDILEPLFYEALAVERSDNFYSRLNCKIPFLNGGLFDPINNYDWVHTDIIIPDDLFSNNIETKEGDIGTGILDVFDRYNFTVKEDEPLEKEVAVDPEMLGKVFENLLEVKDRKSKGTYYTPREIVHYMCQESLINYLATKLEGKINKEDIETLIKFGETTVEHDSRVINEGRETPTYSFKLPESVRKHAKLIDENLTTIRVCDPAVGSGAFLVGMMNEVIRTRNALTSYITEKKGRSIYDFKRHAIQKCLYGVDIDLSAVEIAKLRLWLSLIVDEEDIKQIKPLPNLDYKVVQGNSLLSVEKNLFNLDLFNKLEELKPLFFNETNAKKKQEYKNQIDKLISQITNGRKDFDFEVYFSEVFHEKKGFDVLIGNPPWGQKSVKFNEAEKKYFRQAYPSAMVGALDISRLFIEKSILITAPQGSFANVLPDIVLLKNYDSTRKFILTNLAITKIDHWGMAFENVNLDSCTIIGKKNQFSTNNIVVATIHSRDSVTCNKISQNQFLKNEGYKFNLYMDSPTKHLLDKLKASETFGNYFEPHEGIHSGNIRKKLFIDKKIDVHSRKLIFGRKEIQKFYITWAGKWVNYNPDIINKSKGEYAGLGKPEYFEDAKIIVRRTGDFILAALDLERYYFSNNAFVCLPKKNSPINIKYALGILNSNIATWFYRAIQPRKGKLFAELKINVLKQIPMKNATLDRQKPIINLVDKIILAKKTDPRKDTSKEEVKINNLVYDLYELTKNEIKLVENGTSK